MLKKKLLKSTIEEKKDILRTEGEIQSNTDLPSATLQVLFDNRIFMTIEWYL